MKCCFRLLLLALFLTGCIHTVDQEFQIRSGDKSGIVEVNGLQQCTNTPCMIKVKRKLIWVGASKTPNGYQCQDTIHKVVTFPQAPSAAVYPQLVLLNACSDDDTILVDLSHSSENIERGSFKVLDLKKQYWSLGGLDTSWHNRQDEGSDQRYSSLSFAYGKQVYLGDMILVLGELYAAKRNPLDTPQFEIGTKAYVHNAHSTIFYLSGGIGYQRSQNNFATETISPYFGVGMVFNKKTISEMGRVLGQNYFYTPNPENDYQVGTLPYDFYLEYGFNLHTQDWDARRLSYGFRWYY